MYCKYCGKHIDEDSIFCSSCGKKQSNENTGKVVHTTKNIDVNVNLHAPKIKKPTVNRTLERESRKNPKYDDSYHREIQATFVGSIIFIQNFFLNIYGIGTTNEGLYIFIGLIAIVARILITKWVINIAIRQNRDKTSWGIYGFLAPSVALICIGLTRKLNKRDGSSDDHVSVVTEVKGSEKTISTTRKTAEEWSYY